MNAREELFNAVVVYARENNGAKPNSILVSPTFDMTLVVYSSAVDFSRDPEGKRTAFMGIPYAVDQKQEQQWRFVVAGQHDQPVHANALLSRIDLQLAEFDAAAELAKQYRRVELTAVVDDEYPWVRADYERALVSLLAAAKANGRT